MVKGPTYYNPRRNPERALERRNLVLDLWPSSRSSAPMRRQGQAGATGVTQRGSMADSSYPAFLDLVKRQLREDYRDEDLTEEGLRVFTSFDPVLQLKAEQAMSETLKRLGKATEGVEGAMIVTNPETGEIRHAGQPPARVCRLQSGTGCLTTDRFADQAGHLPPHWRSPASTR